MRQPARFLLALATAVLAIAGCATPVPSSDPSLRKSAPPIAGTTVLDVATAIAARDRGAGGPIWVQGWFSMAPMHSCPAPAAVNGTFRQPNPLELYCQVGDWVLAERPEPAADVTITNDQGRTSLAVSRRTPTGPWLQPVIGDVVGDIFPAGDAQTWRPIEVTFVGHFRDPRAATCLPELRLTCAERFVVERVVEPLR